MRNLIHPYLFLIAFLLGLNSCENVVQTVPTVVTFPVSNIEQQTATCGGTITTDGDVAITEMGVCWSNKAIPTLADSITKEGAQGGSFMSTLQNLMGDSTYYVRAYATNKIGTGYGSIMKFKTKHATLGVLTIPPTDITLSSASCGAIITVDKGKTVNSRGLCWSTSPLPTTADSKTDDGSGDGSFVSTITGLTSNSTYYVRAYAVSGTETVYGSIVVFKTRQIALNVTTLTVTDMSQTTANCGGIVSCDIESSVTERGICWNTNGNPTINDNKNSAGPGVGSFSGKISGLISNTTYYVRAYATNMEGTAYGSTMTFVSGPGIPVITTLSVRNINATTAVCDAKVLNNGGSPITIYGVCFSTQANPTLANSSFTNVTPTTDNFSHTISGLNNYTTYYVRAYATSSVGTGYGSVLSFTTTGTAPDNGVVFNSALTYGTVNDTEGNVYRTITIGSQTWMAENLRSTMFRNGAFIPTTDSLTQDISNESAPIYQWATGNTSVFGRLYTWNVATDSRNICPVGWHIPTDAEWTVLIDNLAGLGVAGDKLKETGAVHWGSTNTSATNESGFTALPGGYKMGNYVLYPNSNVGVWWSSTSNSSDSGVCRSILSNGSTVSKPNYSKKYGISIRCVKD